MLLGYPRPSLAKHRCTVGIDWDPPMCLDAQGGIKAKRQPIVAGVLLKSCVLDVVGEMCCHERSVTFWN